MLVLITLVACTLTYITTNTANDDQLTCEEAELVALATTQEEEGLEAGNTEHVVEVLRNRTSSYEDIYTGVELEQADIVQQTAGDSELDVGDRFDTRHPDTHLMRRADGRTSSFEDLYGGGRQDVQGKGEDNGEAEKMPDDESVASEPSVKVVHPPLTSSSAHKPIDVTYSSGLNLIGQDESADEPEFEHDRLSRTGSLNIRAPSSRKHFHRQLSSPDGSGFPDFQEEPAHGILIHHSLLTTTTVLLLTTHTTAY